MIQSKKKDLDNILDQLLNHCNEIDFLIDKLDQMQIDTDKPEYWTPETYSKKEFIKNLISIAHCNLSLI